LDHSQSRASPALGGLLTVPLVSKVVEVMATNGNGKKPSIKRQPVPKPTAAQQRARREFVQRSGHKFTKEEIDKIRSQWVD
jgi:hypothetical protein